MKTWLRLTLVTMTVGGGFTGVVLTLQALQSSIASQDQTRLNLLLMVVFLVLNACVTVSGLLFVHDSHRTHPLIAALAIQVPWISSSLIAYRFAAGLELVLSVNGPAKSEDSAIHIGGAYFLGNSWSFSLLEEHPFGLGVNLFALVMLILLLRSVRMPTPVAQATSSAPLEPNSTAPLDNCREQDHFTR